MVRSLLQNHGRHLQPGARRVISETERAERSGSEPGRASPIQPLRFRNSYNGEHLDTPECCDSKQECWNCQAAIRIECSPHPFKKKPYCDPRENNYRSKAFHTLTGSNGMKCISFYVVRKYSTHSAGTCLTYPPNPKKNLMIGKNESSF